MRNDRHARQRISEYGRMVREVGKGKKVVAFSLTDEEQLSWSWKVALQEAYAVEDHVTNRYFQTLNSHVLRFCL
jgi:hypothetical protein